MRIVLLLHVGILPTLYVILAPTHVKVGDIEKKKQESGKEIVTSISVRNRKLL